MSASNFASATAPLHAASLGDFAEEVIFEPSDTQIALSPLDSTLELEPGILLEPNPAAFYTSRNRAERTSASSHTSSGSDSTNLNSPDSDSDASSEPESLFDRNTEAGTTISEVSEVQTWGSGSTDSGDHSTNSVPLLPAYSEVGDGDMNSTYIPNLDDLAASRNVGHDPAPGTQSHLPCPFRWDGCEVRFDIAEKKKWLYHSLDHFDNVRPPAHLICPYGDCSERFVNENRLGNWKNRMEHYAQHVEERLEQLRESRGWAEDDDLDLEGLGILNMPEKVDINFQQYMIHHGANKIGLDMLIDPKPRSELDNIPRGYMNRMHPAYGGPRFREVVYPPFDFPPEKNLDSRSAGAMFVRDSRRTGEAGKVLTARTSGEPFKPKLPRQYSLGGRREACERIIHK
ncbi:hypothetical protein L211DRAFT_890863 [Terfezia boudieri ATCC MYA-4762]|uniref:Uncharacterized protein n=1 Tax=Terfezia boudieri ATCC MYA-4762 TaxID=1051890 RepID=A0A3N4LY20_9PEZI|nr:hypothetical protein L211DRAFT_890863 [Terfezia boudieri ATCC MYA-4762]